jgi:DNA topoisomerase-1
LSPSNPFTITLEKALELIAEKKEVEAKKNIKSFEGTDIKVLNGRYGPYVTDGKKNAKIPKDKKPEDLTQEECEKMIAEAPAKGARKRFVKKKSVAKKKSVKKKK